MFWAKNDAPSQNIELLLGKENVTVEEFLEEDDIIQECKTQKKSLVNYFTRPEVIRRMIELITTEPPEDLPMALRFRHANVACEILLLGLPSLDEKLLSDTNTLRLLYSYLENEPPLNPLLASFFSKTFSMLFTKKSDQDWFLYQQMCLQLLEYLKMQHNFLDLICKHFTAPVIPDLIMEMMRNVEGGQLRRSLYEWLNEERLVEKLIDIIGDPEQSEKHANVAQFLCDLIHQGRTMRQTEQDMDSFEPTFEGSNPILKNIESATTLFALFNVILQPNAMESAIVSGITVVLKIIKPVMVLDERNADRLKFLQDREKEIHDELLSTVIRVIEPQLKQFNELLKNPPKKPDIVISAAVLSPPFGVTRLQICRLFTELLQTRNEEIAKAICETDFLDILLALFKQYCWNNFLHSEVEKSLHTIFYSALANNSNTNNNSGAEISFEQIFKDMLDYDSSTDRKSNSDNVGESGNKEKDNLKEADHTAEQLNVTKENDADVTKSPANPPSAIQTHVIVNCKIVSKLIECWQINKEVESAESGRRLGYMGHLIKIFKHITSCISESEHIGALIDNNLKDETERDLWQSIVNTTDGDLTLALHKQSKLLANCEACGDNASLDFLLDYNLSDAFNSMCDFMDTPDTFGPNIDDDEDEEEENAAAGDNGLSMYVQPSSLLSSFPVTSNPWDTNDDFDVLKAATTAVPWAADFPSDNFADFDAHFSSFPNDMGDSLKESTTSTLTADAGAAATGHTNVGDGSINKPEEQSLTKTSSEEYDNNANVEKSSWSGDFSSFQIPQKDKPYTPSNFIDDYEDDEGMWTKPLGGSSAGTDEHIQTETEPLNETDESKTSITNGPSKLHDLTEDEPKTVLNQLNNLIDDNASKTENTTGDITSTENNENQVTTINNDINMEQDTTPKHTIHTPDEDVTQQQTKTVTATVTEALTSTDDSTTTVNTT